MGPAAGTGAQGSAPVTPSGGSPFSPWLTSATGTRPISQVSSSWGTSLSPVSLLASALTGLAEKASASKGYLRIEWDLDKTALWAPLEIGALRVDIKLTGKVEMVSENSVDELGIVIDPKHLNAISVKTREVQISASGDKGVGVKVGDSVKLEARRVFLRIFELDGVSVTGQLELADPKKPESVPVTLTWGMKWKSGWSKLELEHKLSVTMNTTGTTLTYSATAPLEFRYPDRKPEWILKSKKFGYEIKVTRSNSPSVVPPLFPILGLPAILEEALAESAVFLRLAARGVALPVALILSLPAPLLPADPVFGPRPES
jgi:hypothetical protein